MNLRNAKHREQLPSFGCAQIIEIFEYPTLDLFEPNRDFDLRLFSKYTKTDYVMSELNMATLISQYFIYIFFFIYIIYVIYHIFIINCDIFVQLKYVIVYKNNTIVLVHT